VKPRVHRTRRLLGVAAAAALAAVVLSGCAEDPLAAQYRSGNNERYIAGDGTFTEVPLADRAAPVDFSGTLADGTEISSADYRGSVTVVNFWYAECPPCRLEAKDLQAASEEHAPDGVRFLGVNTRDRAPNVDSFDRTYGITYPSVLDVEDTSMQLAFAGTIAPNAVPATIVLDREGRVASRVLGQIDPGVLRTLVTDTVAEAAG
jgi:peroxiredoxin